MILTVDGVCCFVVWVVRFLVWGAWLVFVGCGGSLLWCFGDLVLWIDLTWFW